MQSSTPEPQHSFADKQVVKESPQVRRLRADGLGHGPEIFARSDTVATAAFTESIVPHPPNKGLVCVVIWALAGALPLMANRVSAQESEAGPTARQAPGGGIDVRADQTRLEDVLQQLAAATDRNIVVGSGVDGRRITVSLRDMTLTEILEAILPGAGCGYRDQGHYIIVDALDVLRARESVSEDQEVRVVLLKFTNATDMLEMIEPFKSPTGKIVATPKAAQGIAGGQGDTGGDSIAGRDVLIIEDTPTRIAQIVSVIDTIDVQPMQVLVEATILRSVLSDDNEMGVDLNFLGGVDFESIGGTSVGGTNLTPGEVPPAKFEDGVAAITTILGGPTSPAGFTFGLIKNNLAIFIRALEELTDTVVLANPKILTLNKHRGQFIVGRRDGYLTTTVTETAAVQAVEFLETGTQLTFRPFVLDDNRVRMEIHVEDSAGGLTPSDLPFENTTESTSNIIVEDGHTIFIGGLFRSSDDVSRSQVPGLGEIPVLGAAFRRSRDQSQREEVMVLMTVHVIKHDRLYNELGDRMRIEANDVRLGLRERMQWFGRQKLAEAHLESAVEHLDAGRRDRALFHTRMALSSDPTLALGRRLRAQLEREAGAIGPNLELRDWVNRQLILRPAGDQAAGQPLADDPGEGP